MSALDDLKASIAALGTSISAEIQAVSDKIGALQTGGATADDLAGLKATVDKLKDTVDAETATLTAAPNPPTT